MYDICNYCTFLHTVFLLCLYLYINAHEVGSYIHLVELPVPCVRVTPKRPRTGRLSSGRTVWGWFGTEMLPAIVQVFFSGHIWKGFHSKASLASSFTVGRSL